MKILHALLLIVVLGFQVNAVGRAADSSSQVKELIQLYARDDQRLAGALHYVKKPDAGDAATLRQEAWALETGEVIKIAQEKRQGAIVTLEEYSMEADRTVYFAFQKTEEKQPDGGTRVTEVRTYTNHGFEVISKRRRIADFPAGEEPKLSPALKSEELDLKKLPEADRTGAKMNIKVGEMMEELCQPESLVHDPAKDAPAEWRRVKLVRESLSPDGRYALAIAPKKKDFDWDEYRNKDLGEKEYMLDSEDPEDIENFIVDLRGHRVIGKTIGHHFGNRARYNHRTCAMTWSPDSHYFVQLTDTKWEYVSCGIGAVEDGKLIGVLNLGKAAQKRAAEFLVATRQREYRQHAKEMVVALFEPQLKNDGTGTMRVIFQVIKSTDVSVDVRFRVSTGNKGLQLEMLGAALAK